MRIAFQVPIHTKLSLFEFTIGVVNELIEWIIIERPINEQNQ